MIVKLLKILKINSLSFSLSKKERETKEGELGLDFLANWIIKILFFGN
jgi:hypothetical protein